MRKITIALIDDDALIVELIKSFLDQKEEIEVVLSANCGEEFIDQLKKQDPLPEIVLLDLKMKEMTGIDVTSELQSSHPKIKVIVMSSHYKLSFMGFMLKSGVSAFLPKGISPSQLLQVIQEVDEKGHFFLPEQLEVLRNQISSKTPKPSIENQNHLSERELEVLKLICQQKTAPEIAEELFISARTVEGHKNNLFVKTGARNTAGLVIYAIQQQLIDPSEIPLI